MARLSFRLAAVCILCLIPRSQCSQNTAACDTVETLPTHDRSCFKQGLLTPQQLSAASSVYKYQVTFARLYKNPSPSVNQIAFEQFAYVHVEEVGTRDMLSVTTRAGCERSLESTVSFQRTYATDKPGQPSVYSTVLPPCSEKKKVSPTTVSRPSQSKTKPQTNQPTMCTTFVVVQPSRKGILYQQRNHTLNFTITFHRGVVLPFHRDRFAFQPQTEPSHPTKTDRNGFDPKHCRREQLYGAKPSTSDYNVGLIVQLENSVNFDDSHFLNVKEFASDFSVKPRTYTSKVHKLGSGSVTLSYPEPDTWQSGMFLLFRLETSIGTAYHISIQANMSTFQELFMNGAGWFMLIILAVLMLVAICRRIRNANVDDDLNFDFPTGENESIGATSEDLNRTSIEVYSRSHRKHKHKQCAICYEKYKYSDALRRLPCSHLFHRKCIDKWLRDHKRCPICTQRIETARNVHSIDIELSTSRSTSNSLIDGDDLPFSSGYSRFIPQQQQGSHVIDLKDDDLDGSVHSDSNNPFDNLRHDLEASSPPLAPTKTSSHHHRPDRDRHRHPSEHGRSKKTKKKSKSRKHHTSHSIQDKLDLASDVLTTDSKNQRASKRTNARDATPDLEPPKTSESTSNNQKLHSLFSMPFRSFKKARKKDNSGGLEPFVASGLNDNPQTALPPVGKPLELDENPFEQMQEKLSQRPNEVSDSKSTSSFWTVSASTVESTAEKSHSHTISSSTLSPQYLAMKAESTREPRSSEPDVSFSLGGVYHRRECGSLSEPVAARRRISHRDARS